MENNFIEKPKMFPSIKVYLTIALKMLARAADARH